MIFVLAVLCLGITLASADDGYPSSTDYVERNQGITLSVTFTRNVLLSTATWYDEVSEKTYTQNTNPSKRNAEGYSVNDDARTVYLTLPAGVVTQSTSFKVSARIAGTINSRTYRRKYLQVFAPVSPVIIYDVVELPDVFGQADIAITGYTGTPSSVTFDPFPLHYTMAYADNKFTFKVHPTFKQLSENNVIKTTASIQLTDNVDSQADILFEFYKIDIETSPKVTKGDQVNIVYEETMDEEEKNATAFTCTFVDKEGNGALVGDSTIKHLTSTDVMATNSTEMLTVEFRDLEHMEEEPELDEEGNEILKVEEYECRYKFTYRGATEEFKRHFVVTLDPDGRNWGGIIAACVIAGIIILLCIFFIIYRCCCVKRKRKGKKNGEVHSNKATGRV